MNLYAKIKALYPEIEARSFTDPNPEIIIRDDMDGIGPYIDKWEHPVLTKPSQEDLDAIEDLPVFDTVAPPQLTPEQKLANAGLTVDELKSLLGIS